MSRQPDRRPRDRHSAVQAPSTSSRQFALAAVLAVCSACTAAESSLIAPSSSKCQVAVANSMSTVPASGGAGSLAITTTRDCTWAASGNANWIVITSPSNGQGDGAVEYRVAANQEPAARRSTIDVNSETVSIVQEAAACRFGVTPVTVAVNASGGTATVQVQTHASCTWSTTSDAGWITIGSGASGSGNGSVGLSIASNGGAARSAAVVVAGTVVTVSQADGSPSVPPLPPPPPPPSAPGCTYSIQPSGQTMAASGGPGTIAVTAGAACAWTAVSNDSWIAVTAGASGSGAAPVSFNVAANSGASRTGTISVAGQTFTLSQAGVSCSYSISPATAAVPADGGNSTVTVSAGAPCAWTSASNTSWITFGGSASGTGGGAVTLNIAANTGAARSGTATIAGQTFTVTQSPAPCTFSISPASLDFPATGGTGSTALTAGAGCAWTAATQNSWITITEGASGTGNGVVKFSVAASDAAARSGTVVIGGQTLIVTQQAVPCTFALAPPGRNIDAAGGSGSVTVSTGPTCGWTAASNSAWLTITAGAAGTGGGMVSYAVAANAGASRNGSLTIGGQAFTVVQDAACTFSIAPASQTIGAAGGSGAIAVTTAASCAWRATSNSTWLTIDGPSSGAGNGSVSFSAAPNSGMAREGTIVIAGQTFTLAQPAP